MSEDDTIYEEEGREELMDDSEITPEEEAFMKGYDDAEDEDDSEENKPSEESD